MSTVFHRWPDLGGPGGTSWERSTKGAIMNAKQKRVIAKHVADIKKSKHYEMKCASNEEAESLCYHIADGMGATVDCEVDGDMLYFRNDPLACSFDEAVSTDFAEVVADWTDFKDKVQLKGV
jgi:hypothetical protein